MRSEIIYIFIYEFSTLIWKQQQQKEQILSPVTWLRWLRITGTELNMIPSDGQKLDTLKSVRFSYWFVHVNVCKRGNSDLFSKIVCFNFFHAMV